MVGPLQKGKRFIEKKKKELMAGKEGRDHTGKRGAPESFMWGKKRERRGGADDDDESGT